MSVSIKEWTAGVEVEDAARKIRKRGWQLNELERMRELRRLAKEAKQREEIK